MTTMNEETATKEKEKVTKETAKKISMIDRLGKIEINKNVEYPNPKIMIGVPILAWSHRFALSFLNFWTELTTYQKKGRTFQVCYNFKYRRPVHLAEEELANDAIDAGCTHLLLMDDDIYDVTVADFLALLDADKEIIGGIMHTSGFPYAMCAFRRYDQKTAVKDQPNLKDSCRLYEIPPEQRVGIQPADLIPFGFTLIKTRIFDKIPKPWFQCDSKAPTDSYFADTVLGFKMQYYAHFGVWLNHNDTTVHTKNLKIQLGLLEHQLNNKGKVIELTPEMMATHEAMMRQKMEDAEESFKQARKESYQFLRVEADDNEIETVKEEIKK